MARSLSHKSSKRSNLSASKKQRSNKVRKSSRSNKTNRSNKVRKSSRSNKANRSNKVRKSSRSNKANRINKVRKSSRSHKTNRSNKVRKSSRSHKANRSNKRSMRGGSVLPSEYFGRSSGNYHSVGSSALSSCPRQFARSHGVIHADGKFAGPILHPKQ